MNQFATAYGINPLYAAGNGGAGVTIALYELEPHLATDIQDFQDCYGTSASVTEIDVDGGAGVGAGSGEAALDIEVAVGLAPEADVLVYQAPNTNAAALHAYARIADDDTAQVISTSWGSCEPFMSDSDVAAEETIFQQMAAQGQTIVAAAGDDGSEDCYDPTSSPRATELAVDDPGSHPSVTSVGGTQLTSPSFPPVEQVWNEQAMQEGAGGGGISTDWAMPAFQTGPGVMSGLSSGDPCGASYAYCRQVPDVSAAADPRTGYIIAHNGRWGIIGGTSAAAPLWGAVTTLAAASPQCQPTGRVGLLNPILYMLAPSTLGALNDVTVGNNDYLGLHGGLYPATVAYDMASGLGTPVASQLAVGLCGGVGAPTITSAASAAFTAGTASSFTITTSGTPIAALNASGTLPAGVTFTDAGNGSATLAGTPTAGRAGIYSFGLGASNGIGTAASQGFTLTVAAPPPPSPPPRSLPQATARSLIRLGSVPRRVFTIGRRGGLAVPLTCPAVAGGCVAAATLAGPLQASPHGHIASPSRTLARASGWQIAPGRTRSIWLVVGARRLRQLQQGDERRVRARLTVTARFANGRSTRTLVDVVLRLPR
jgi:subtilase family serine protease